MKFINLCLNLIEKISFTIKQEKKWGFQVYMMNKCKICKKEHYNKIYCSRKCYYGQQTKIKCKICKKIFYIPRCFSKIRKYCSRKCYLLDFEILSNRSKKAIETQKIKKNGFMSLEAKTKSHYTNKKQKSGFCYNPEIHKKAGLASIEAKRNKLNFEFQNIKFHSVGELEIAMNIHYQLNIKLQKRKNVHIIVDSKEFDFLIEKYKCFIEYHKEFLYYQNKIETKKNYYIRRRKILNKNGYKDYNLLVI